MGKLEKSRNRDGEKPKNKDKLDNINIYTDIFFPIDKISLMVLIIGLCSILLAFLPIIVQRSITIFGYPWLFITTPTFGMALAVIFIVITYYIDIHYSKGGSNNG